MERERDRQREHGETGKSRQRGGDRVAEVKTEKSRMSACDGERGEFDGLRAAGVFMCIVQKGY